MLKFVIARYKRNTNKDPEYLQTSIPIKPINKDNMTKIGIHIYALRSDILSYIQIKLKQLKLDYQEIISHTNINST